MNRTSKLVVLWPDTHFPHHDPKAVSCAKRICEHLQPDQIVFLGDMMDCEKFSSHPKRTMAERERVSFEQQEMQPFLGLLDWAQDLATRRVSVIEGNHEARLEAAAANNDSIASVYENISPRERTKGRKSFDYIPYNSKDGLHPESVLTLVPDSARMKSGPLIAVHGWSHAKNAAAKHLEATSGESIVFGHTHRVDLECQRHWRRGHRLIAQSFGCLRTLHPSYARGGKPTNWVHGLGLLWVGRSSWQMHGIEINDGHAILEGGTKISA